MAWLILREDSSNVSASFKTREEALAALRAAIKASGEHVTQGKALAHSPARGGLRIIAEDAELARLAMREPHGKQQAA